MKDRSDFLIGLVAGWGFGTAIFIVLIAVFGC